MIDKYVNDIRNSLSHKCYFSALALALTLPDICGRVEYPDTSVAEGYISWYDKYLGNYFAQGKDDLGGNNPWLSGEVIYNLRNTFLHQGSPKITTSKIKEDANRVDRFILILGDGTQIWDSTLSIDIGNGRLKFRTILVELTFLCDSICHSALKYYLNNKDKFSFDFKIYEQNDFLSGEGQTRNILNHPTVTIKKSSWSLPEQDLINEKIDNKREAQVRSYFGRSFKEKRYREKKEEIIQSILKGRTKMEVNNNLMKYFSNAETGEIYRKLLPLIKDIPGK